MHPSVYLHDGEAAALADKVWDYVSTIDYPLTPVYEGIANLPWTARRIVKTSGWMTETRFTKGAIEKLFGAGYSAKTIAAVEHFFVGALIGSLGGPGAGPVGGFWASAVWDVAVSPIQKLLSGKGLAAVRYDLEQFGGPDLQGVAFGSFFNLHPS